MYFDAVNQLLIRSAFVRYWGKMYRYIEAVHNVFIDSMKVHVSVRW